MPRSEAPTLAPELARLSKPAQRALLAAGIRTPKDLARRTLDEVLALHGVGPASVPVLRAALAKHGLSFK